MLEHLRQKFHVIYYNDMLKQIDKDYKIVKEKMLATDKTNIVIFGFIDTNK